MKRLLPIALILSGLIAYNDNPTVLSDHKLLVAKDGEGLLLWSGSGTPKSIFEETFNGKTFVRNAFDKRDSIIRVRVMESMYSSGHYDTSVYKWSNYNINLQSMTCELDYHNEFTSFEQYNGDGNAYPMRYKKTNKMGVSEIFNDTVLPIKYSQLDKIEFLDPIAVAQPQVKSVDRGNDHFSYLLGQKVYVQSTSSSAKVLYQYDGHYDFNTGNGIFNIDMSDDGELVLVPILKTEGFEFITASGKGKVLILNSTTGQVVREIKLRTLTLRMSPDNKQIAYLGKGVRIYDLDTEKDMKLLSGQLGADFMWTK
jgi:WD40 repeat protein